MALKFLITIKKKFRKIVLNKLHPYSIKNKNLKDLYLLIEKFQLLIPKIELYVNIWFILSGVFGILIIYCIYTNQVYAIYWLKFFSKIFLFVGVGLKSYSDYICLKLNVKKFTDQEFNILKKFLFVKYFFRGLLVVIGFILFIQFMILQYRYLDLLDKHIKYTEQLESLDKEILELKVLIKEQEDLFIRAQLYAKNKKNGSS